MKTSQRYFKTSSLSVTWEFPLLFFSALICQIFWRERNPRRHQNQDRRSSIWQPNMSGLKLCKIRPDFKSEHDKLFRFDFHSKTGASLQTTRTVSGFPWVDYWDQEVIHPWRSPWMSSPTSPSHQQCGRERRWKQIWRNEAKMFTQ